MAPRKASTEGSEQPQSLTEGELRFIKAIFDNMTQKPDANWENVAQVLSLKDAKCAKERWRQMSVRHGWREGASGSVAGGVGGGAGGNGSPSKTAAGAGKVTKKPRAPRKKAKKSDSEDEAAKTEVKSEENEEVKVSQEEI